MRRGRKRGRSERYTRRRTPLLCNTHGGYRCIVTLLSPQSSLYGRTYELTRNPDSPVVTLSTVLCTPLPYIRELNLSLVVLHYVPLVLYESRSFALISSHSFPTCSPVSLFTGCSDAFNIERITILINLNFTSILLSLMCILIS